MSEHFQTDLIQVNLETNKCEFLAKQISVYKKLLARASVKIHLTKINLLVVNVFNSVSLLAHLYKRCLSENFIN